MKTIVAIASSAALLNTVHAEIRGDIVCPSACGLFGNAAQCKDALPIGEFCKSLEKMPDGTIRLNPGFITESRRVTVEEAQALVQAPDNNCFAMYYERESLRSEAEYCASNNVCPKLFWDKHPDGEIIAADAANRTFRFAHADDSNYNMQSAVLCDFASSQKKPVTEDKKDGRDPCKSLCAMSHKDYECALVERQQGICDRLFWSNESRSVTQFSVRARAEPQQFVKVDEARDLLEAEDNDCTVLCMKTGTCAQDERGSFCSDSRTCQNLFFNPNTGLSRLEVCFTGDEDCKGLTETPVHCRQKGDAPSKGFTVSQAGLGASKKTATAASSAVQVAPVATNGDAEVTSTTTSVAFGASTLFAAVVVALVSFV